MTDDNTRGLSHKPYLTPDEAMRYLGISRTSIYRLIHTGQIPVLRLGRIFRVSREALDDLAASPRDLSTVGPPTPNNTRRSLSVCDRRAER